MTVYNASYTGVTNGSAHEVTDSTANSNDTVNGDYFYLTQNGSGSHTATANGYADYIEQDGGTNLIHAIGPHTFAEFIGGVNHVIFDPSTRGSNVYLDQGGTTTIDANGTTIGSTKYTDPGLMIGPNAGGAPIHVTLNGYMDRDMIVLDKAWGVPNQAAWAKGISSDGHGGAMFTSPNGLLHIDFTGVSVSAAQAVRYDILPISGNL